MGTRSSFAILKPLCWMVSFAAVTLGVAGTFPHWQGCGQQSELQEWATWEEFLTSKVSPELLQAIRREQAAVKRLKSRPGVRMRDDDPAWDRERSELDHWLADLTNGDTTHPRFWTATIKDVTELDSIAEDLTHLRHIEQICVVFRGWTEATSASVRRLPPADELMLLIEDELPAPPEEPPYHLLEGLPFTCVEIHNVPLTKSISRWLPTLPLLETLGLGYCKLTVSDDAWADLPQCRRLSAVVTCFVEVSNSGMKSIGKIQNLKRLGVHHLDVRNRQVLSQLPATLELDSLSITGCSMFGDLSLSELSVDPVELNLKGTSVKFVAWGRKWLLSRKRLKHVTIPDFDISADEVKQLNALGGPQITLTSPCW